MTSIQPELWVDRGAQAVAFYQAAFGLDLADQQRTCFIYAYSVYQAEYSRNLLFASGRQMQDVFDAAVDRTRSRLDVPQVITLFGAKTRPRTARGRPPRLEVAIETPAYDLTKFKVHFGNLTLKGYTKDAMWEGPPRRRS